MEQGPAERRCAPVSTAQEDDAEGTSCECHDPDPTPSGVCGRCFRLMWQTGPLVVAEPASPVAGILFCPSCGKQHVDEGEWATRPHRRHLCLDDARGAGCGARWEVVVIVTDGDELLVTGAVGRPPLAGPGSPGKGDGRGSSQATATAPPPAPAPALPPTPSVPAPVPARVPPPQASGCCRGSAGFGAPGVHVCERPAFGSRIIRR
jgi:hypothetical protein